MTFVLGGGLLHSASFRTTEAIDVLMWVSNSDKTASRKALQQAMVNGGEVLVFIDKDSWELRICSSEQCWHVHLIVIVNESIVSRLNGSDEDTIDKITGKVIWYLVKL